VAKYGNKILINNKKVLKNKTRRARRGRRGCSKFLKHGGHGGHGEVEEGVANF
jgi:hypothetical protein